MGILDDDKKILAGAGLRILVATTDVHEHGKMLLELVLEELGVEPVDGGVSVEPAALAARLADSGCDALALSSYNGVALTYAEDLIAALAKGDVSAPVLIGGRLNQIPKDSNSSLPVDVSQELTQLGVIVCRDVEAVAPALREIVIQKAEGS